MDKNLSIRLKDSLQALAAPADVQIGLFPEFVVVADELALDLQNWSGVAVQGSIADERKSALRRLDQELSELGKHKGLWSLDALKHSQEWERVRIHAQTTLEAFGWEAAIPPSYRHEFVRERKD